jgi:acyl-CoA oxidase
VHKSTLASSQISYMEGTRRVETSLGTCNTSVLPRHYASTSREELYQEGLRAGRVAFEDELKYNYEYFLEATPRGTIANAR